MPIWSRRGSRHHFAKPWGLAKLRGGAPSPVPAPTKHPCTLPPHAPSTLQSLAIPCATLETRHVLLARVLRGDSPSYLCAAPTAPQQRPRAPRNHPHAPTEEHHAAKHQLCYSLKGWGQCRKKESCPSPAQTSPGAAPKPSTGTKHYCILTQQSPVQTYREDL